MAEVLVTGDWVAISMNWLEKIGALHGDVSVERRSIVAARAVPDGISQVRGIRAPGTAIPWFAALGTYRRDRGGNSQTTFAVCYRKRSALILNLTGAHFDLVVVSHPDASRLAAQLTPT